MIKTEVQNGENQKQNCKKYAVWRSDSQSSSALTTFWIGFTVAPSSVLFTLVNSQVVSLRTVGILDNVR